MKIQGKFYALSHLSRIDHGNSFAVLPTGKMYLSLDKDTYEQMGLVGSSSTFPPKDQRRNILYIILYIYYNIFIFYFLIYFLIFFNTFLY